MIYRKKYLDKFNLRFLVNKKQGCMFNKIQSSFKLNYSQTFNKRNSFYIKNFYTNKNLQFYKSQNKPICFITFSPKVPSSKLLLSRFFLVKNTDRLLLGGYQK